MEICDLARAPRPTVEPEAWRTVGPQGPSDPVTILVRGDLDTLEQRATEAGWTKADPLSVKADVKYVWAAARQVALDVVAGVLRFLSRGRVDLHPSIAAVQRMPMDAETLAGRPSVSEFERNNRPLGGRDHFRVYELGEKDRAGRPVYGIATSRDVGIRFDPRRPASGFLNHVVDPDVREERDLVKEALAAEAARVKTFGHHWDHDAAESVHGEVVPDNLGYEIVYPRTAS